MFEPDDIPNDNLDDLLDLEYEAEMDLMRELEEEAAEIALRSQVFETGDGTQKYLKIIFVSLLS
jgi:hypothetical protein